MVCCCVKSVDSFDELFHLLRQLRQPAQLGPFANELLLLDGGYADDRGP